MKARFEALMAEYGKVALVTYLILFVVVLAGFATAIALGIEVESAAGSAGTLGAAYVATKLTQPVRIGATVVLTPLVARIARRVRGTPRVEVARDEHPSAAPGVSLTD